jgi:hypothetical protein
LFFSGGGVLLLFRFGHRERLLFRRWGIYKERGV